MSGPASQASPCATTSEVGSFAGPWFNLTARIQTPSERASLAPDDSSSEGHPSMNAGSEISSFLPVTPVIRRLFAREVDTIPVSRAARRMLKSIDQDGSFQCPRRDCDDALPSRGAYTCHIHIHLIHEGYGL